MPLDPQAEELLKKLADGRPELTAPPGALSCFRPVEVCLNRTPS